MVIPKSGKNYQDNFAFDATGNWSTYKQDTTGVLVQLRQEVRREGGR